MNGHDISTDEATEHLRNMLQLGKNETKPLQTSLNNMDSSDLGSFGNHNKFQRIELSGNEETLPIYGVDCSIYSSPLHHNAGCSNQILIDNIVDYSWEHKFQLGRLVCVHLSKKYLAYASKGFKGGGLPESGFVRVIKHHTNSHVRIREFSRSVIDLCFAHSQSQIMLGCVDEIGELFVFEIFDEPSDLSYKLVTHIVRPGNPIASIYHRIAWCPFIPDEETELENAESNSDSVINMMTSLLIVTHDDKAEVWDIDIIKREYGSQKIVSDSVKIGMQVIDQHSQPIATTCFSPDGIAVATASLDGEVKFFQVNARESSVPPKYLHQWIPHAGKPLTSLFFLDNHKNFDTEDQQFWKYAVTGADQNQEIKVWSCKSWECLQTIRFKYRDDDLKLPCLVADVDLSANHLVLSDINHKILYLFKLSDGCHSHTIQYMSVYPLKYSVLSLAISDVISKRIKRQMSNDNEDDDDDDEDEQKSENEEDDKEDDDEEEELEKTNKKYCVNLFWITVKAFQSCQISYGPKPNILLQSEGSDSSSHDSFDLADIKGSDSNLSASMQQPGKSSSMLSGNSANLSSPSGATNQRSSFGEILLTPNDFSNNSLPSSKSNSFKLNDLKDASGDRHIIISKDTPMAPEIQARRKSSQHSSTSSPSREVAEILSPSQLLDPENLNIDAQTKQEPTETDNQLHNDHTYDRGSWPIIPDTSQEYKHMPRVDSEQNVGLRNIPVSAPMPAEDSQALLRVERLVESLTHKMNSISDAMVRQNQSIQFLQGEIQNLQKQQTYMQNSMQNQGLDTAVASKIENVVSENAISEFARIEELFTKWEDSDKHRFEQHAAGMSQNLHTGISSKLDKLVKQEIKVTLMPNINKYLDTLFARLQGEMLLKLNTTDSALKECVSKHLKSKAFSDNIIQATVSIIQQSLQMACKDTFQSSVVPAFDKSCRILFSQLNEVCGRGIQDYIQHVEQHKQAFQANMDTIATKYQGQIEKIANHADMAFKQNATWQASATEFSNQHWDAMITKIRQTIHDEIQKAMKEHTITATAALRSNMSTPAPMIEPKCNVQSLISLAKRGQYNEAFDQALTAVDLKLVLTLCEHVSVDDLFGESSCALQQNVLLSLIHQISVDLHEKTELKVRYIEDAIASLDEGNLNKSHISMVLGGLRERVKTFIDEHPKHKLNRKLKRIYLAIEAFMK